MLQSTKCFYKYQQRENHERESKVSTLKYSHKYILLYNSFNCRLFTNVIMGNDGLKIQQNQTKARIHLLDEIRGFAIVCMVFYHAFYTLDAEFNFEIAGIFYRFFEPFQDYFAMLFIFISGISSHLSRNNLIRGIKLLAIAMAITLFTAVIMPEYGMGGNEIYFGILHFLSIAMLIFSGLKNLFNKISVQVGVLISLILYIATRFIEDGILGIPELLEYHLPKNLYSLTYFFPIGIYTDKFFSADYFPIFPYIFVFFAGTFVGKLATGNTLPNFLYKSNFVPLQWIGRHTLIIYVLHQPIIFGIAFLIETIIK